MKNINEIMKDLGVEVPEEKKAEFEKTFKENYKTIADYEKVVETRDNYKNSLDDVQTQLDTFKDVNVDDLKNQITTLKNDLQTKEQEYATKESARIFNDSIIGAIKEAGGKNAKAVMALLDVETLKASKNQKEDIETAINSVKESDAYLFGTDEPFSNPIGNIGGNGGAKDEVNTLSAIRAAMGLPKENK